MIVPFQIPSDPEGLSDLNRRLKATRWNDAVVPDWSYGMERGFLRKLVGYWSDRYDWAERRALLNRLPHFWATLDGYGLHFLHYRERGPNPVPLLLMNGWPSSFVEYQRLAVLLSHGEPSFDVVVPTHPGFGFSDRPTRPYQIEPADLYPKLITALGHERFMVSGTDVGSGVATRIALRHMDRVIAAHISAIAEKHRAPGASPPSAAERDYAARAEIQMAAAAGAEVIASVRNPSTREAVERAGAARAIDPSEVEANGPSDVVLELVGATNFESNLRSLNLGGRIVFVGAGAGREANIDFGIVGMKRATIRASTLRSRALEEKAIATRAVEREVLPLVARGKITVPVAARYSFAEAAAAYEAFSTPGKFGKIILLPYSIAAEA